MLTALSVRDRHDTYDFRAHPAVCKESDTVLDGIPDEPPRFDRVDAAEETFANLFGSLEAFATLLDIKLVVHLLAEIRRGFDLRPAKVIFQIALTGQVHRLNYVRVDQLQPRKSHGRELKSYLSTDGPHTYDCGTGFGQPLRRHDVTLTHVSVRLLGSR